MTRGGSTVKIHCTNFLGVNPIIAEIEGSGQSRSFGIDGRYFSTEGSVRDLFFAPEKHEGWLNVYRNPNTGTTSFGTVLYDSQKEAEEVGKPDDYYVATAKVEWKE